MSGTTAENTKVSTKTTRSMVSVYTHGLTDDATRATGGWQAARPRNLLCSQRK
jgi:hypothetical protein